MNSCKDGVTPPDCGFESDTLCKVPSENFPEVPIEEQKVVYYFIKCLKK